MRGLGISFDESGSDGLSDSHYLLTVVMHYQDDDLAPCIEAYEAILTEKDPSVPG